MTQTPERVCSKCNSPRIAYFRLDADWGTGGDLTRLNPPEFYEDNDPQERDEMDIAFTLCFACGGAS